MHLINWEKISADRQRTEPDECGQFNGKKGQNFLFKKKIGKKLKENFEFN